MAVVCGAVGQPTKTAPAPHTHSCAAAPLPGGAGRCGSPRACLLTSHGQPVAVEVAVLDQAAGLGAAPILEGLPEGVEQRQQAALAQAAAVHRLVECLGLVVVKITACRSTGGGCIAPGGGCALVSGGQAR
jgi:hypothetical protein